jgi:transposase
MEALEYKQTKDGTVAEDISNSYMNNKKNLEPKSLVWKRKQMVLYSKLHGVAAAAREFKTTRKTVYLWCKRYKEQSDEGLRNLSRLGQYHPNTLPPEIVKAILEQRGDGKMGANNIKDSLGLNCSSKTIHKYLKRGDKVSKPKN